MRPERQRPIEAAPAQPRAAAHAPEASPARLKLADAVRQLADESRTVGEGLRHDRAVEAFVPVLTGWLPQASEAFERVLRDPARGRAVRRADVQTFESLRIVFEEVKELVRQRRDPELLPLLGDADALAERCYAPVIAFAQAEGLPLSSARPVTQLTDFDPAIWTGFAPTSLAPIFLSPQFFSRAAWWPAIAHEIGHDFLISIPHLRDRLAAELDLPSEAGGTIPLRLHNNQLASSELWRVHGGWFEELFCDVFGTMMCGPAYVASMIELFSATEDPREVLFVPVDPQTGRYDPHPPRHLRVHAALATLERAGMHRDVLELKARWYKKNQLDAEQGVPLLFPVQGQYIYLPFSAFEPLTRELVERLYEGPHESLNGFGLQDISGLDFGPHADKEAERAKASLLSGAVPQVRDPRAIIAGAVLASVERPDQDAAILSRARKAILGVGTFEKRQDAFTLDPALTATANRVIDLSPNAVREAILLREILQRPQTQRRRAPGPRRTA